MSYIGKKAIKFPTSVKVIQEGLSLKIEGHLGNLTLNLPPEINLLIEDGQIFVKYDSSLNSKKINKQKRPLWGTYRSLINSMILGVSRGYNVKLELFGVGYRSNYANGELTLKLGYSHDIVYKVPNNITLKCLKPILIEITGIDKQLVNQVAAEIRLFRRPDAYKGKGVRYYGEIIKLKEGKKK